MKKGTVCLITILLLILSAQSVLGDEWERGPVDVPEWPGFQKEPTPGQPEWEEYKHGGEGGKDLDHYKIVDGELVKVLKDRELPVWEYEMEHEPSIPEWEYETDEPRMSEWEYETEEPPISNRPEPRITRITYNSEMATGQVGYLGIDVVNLGTYSPHAEVILSHSDGIDVVNTSGWPSIHTPGEEVEDIDKNPMKVKHTMLKWTSEFDVGEEETFSLNYRIKGADEQWFKVRLYFVGEGDRWASKQVYPTEFESNVTDQQDFPAVEFYVSVSEPKAPSAALSCLSQKDGNKININFTFKNVGDKTLRNPVFSFGEKKLTGDWDLASDSSKTFNLTLNSFEEDFITKEAKITGCFQPCSRNYFSKTFKVILHEDEDGVHCQVEEIEKPGKNDSKVDYIAASFKEMERAQIIREDKGVVQIVFERINNFFKMFLIR
ncbi:MAG: hypothetical protein ACLFVI_09230 [Archaeoglobaceae archaeon]